MSAPINDGGPAFPVPVERPFGEGLCAIGGMSLRAYAAIHMPMEDNKQEWSQAYKAALLGCKPPDECAPADDTHDNRALRRFEFEARFIAAWRVFQADALIKRLEQP